MNWRWAIRIIFLLCLGSNPTLAATTAPGPDLQAAAEKQWESDLAALDARNQSESHPADSILFVGSSSIRLWESIATDMAPYHPIPRGFGGSRFSDLAVFARRLIAPHQFRALVLFSANDVTGKPDDPAPEQVAGWFGYIVEIARATHPDAPIFCLAVTPTLARWDAWPRIQEVNCALARECATRTNVHFIPTAHAYLGADGRPTPDLFLEDGLHQNAVGYRIWSAIIKSHLDARTGCH